MRDGESDDKTSDLIPEIVDNIECQCFNVFKTNPTP